MAFLTPKTPFYFFIIFLNLAATLFAQNPAPADFQTFNLTNRTSYEIQESQGVRIRADIPGLEWRVLAAPNPVDFGQVLEAAEGDAPFDLVFPLATAPLTNPNRRSTGYPGLLSDRFHPLSLPAPGLEFQIGFDGIWTVVERPEASAGREMQFSLSGKGLRVNQWNVPSTIVAPDNPAVWTPDFFASPALASLEHAGAASKWIALEWMFDNPWPGGLSADLPLPLLNWRNRFARVSRISSNPFSLAADSGEILFRLPRSVQEFSENLQVGQSLTASFLNVPNADRCPTIVGGAYPIVRQGEWAGPENQNPSKSVALPIRQDLAPCFSVNGSPYAWIGISYTSNEVWLGRSGASQARQGVMPPSVLGEQLKPFGLDYAGICSASSDAIAIQWQDQWIGTQNATPPGNITAALCLRLRPHPAKPNWTNALRDPHVTIQARNAGESAGAVDPLRDGRTYPGATMRSFWWASPKDPEQSVILEFDLQKPISVFWIEMLQAAKAGFSAHFNLRDYKWQMRPSASADWTDVAQARQNEQSVSRHIFPQPIQARWWRLVIPPPSNPSEMPIIHRLAEVEFWTQGQSPDQN